MSDFTVHADDGETHNSGPYGIMFVREVGPDKHQVDLGGGPVYAPPPVTFTITTAERRRLLSRGMVDVLDGNLLYEF